MGWVSSDPCHSADVFVHKLRTSGKEALAGGIVAGMGSASLGFPVVQVHSLPFEDIRRLVRLEPYILLCFL